MKLIMTLLVRNEEDIIKENIDFHLNQGVDFIIATDNRSIDSTKDILKEYEKKGQLLYLYEDSDTHNQGTWVTAMARMAAEKYHADWIINNDADEFWWPSKHDTLKQAFSSLSNDYNTVEANRNNFVLIEPNIRPQKFYQKMIYKEYASLNANGNPLPPKQAHKADTNIKVSEGNHKAIGTEPQKIKHELIEIFHFPIRSKIQFTNKIINGAGALMKNTELPEYIGSTWRKLYQQLTEKGNLDDYLKENSFNPEKLKKALNNKTIVKDHRLDKYLRKIYL